MGTNDKTNSHKEKNRGQNNNQQSEINSRKNFSYEQAEKRGNDNSKTGNFRNGTGGEDNKH